MVNSRARTGSALHRSLSGAVFFLRPGPNEKDTLETRHGFGAPPPIQAQAIPPALEGRDVVGVAQTGTGKTAAFLLPSMQRLMTGGQKGRAQAPRMVVLAPTRELALQITEHARRLCHFTHLTVATVYGGAPLGRQTQELRRGVDLVIATPGRLMDHMERRAWRSR